jgi:hypothetical protein
MTKFISIYIKYIVYKSQQAILSTHVVFPLAATVERVPSNTDNSKIKLQITVYSFYACIRASGIFRVVQITPPMIFRKQDPMIQSQEKRSLVFIVRRQSAQFSKPKAHPPSPGSCSQPPRPRCASRPLRSTAAVRPLLAVP